MTSDSSPTRKQYLFMEKRWGIKPWIGPDIEIDAAILKARFQRRIETFDDMQGGFGKTRS